MWLWDIRLWFWQSDLPVWDHCKSTMSTHCHKSIPILIWPQLVCLLMLYILGHIRMHADLWQCALMVTLSFCPTGKPGHQHHHLISHSAILSCHWANQPLPYSNNAECLARKRQESIFKVIGFTWPGFEPSRFGFCNLPEPSGDGPSTYSAIPSGHMTSDVDVARMQNNKNKPY